MNRFAKIALALILAAFFTAPLLGQQPKQELNKKNLAKFIADYAPLMKEMEALQDEIDSPIDPFADESASGANLNIAVLKENVKKAADNPKITAMLKKRAWGTEFWDVLITVTFCALYIQMEDLGSAGAMPQLQDYLNSMKAGLNPADIALVKDSKASVFEAMDM